MQKRATGCRHAPRTVKDSARTSQRASTLPSLWIVDARHPGLVPGTLFLSLLPTVSSAQGLNRPTWIIEDPVAMTLMSLVAILIGTAMICAVYLMRYRARLVDENEALRSEVAKLSNDAGERLALLAADDQRLLVYRGAGQPHVYGQLPAKAGTPQAHSRFLDFAEWLPVEVAGELAALIEQLRTTGRPFNESFDTLNGELVEIAGRTHGGIALVRFSHLGGLRVTLKTIEAEHAEAIATVETMQTLFDTAPAPTWLRGEDGRLVWVNRAYAEAVDLKDPAEAVERQVEFLGETDRRRIAETVATGPTFAGKLSTVVAADRHIFDVTETAGPLGTAGLAIDISETESVRRELRQTIDSQSETLDQLGTAVARFDAETRLSYHNAAFKDLFELTEPFLQGDLDHVALLDHLRSRGVLPTETAFPSQKRQEVLAAYKATEPTEDMWHLSDGRTLRVVATPHPQGGATFVFEDITEKLKLEMQIKTVIRLQRETIDYLSEGVAVFGSDGRLRLSNPVFAEMFGLEDDYLSTNPRIQTFRDLARIRAEVADRGDIWSEFAIIVTSFDEMGRSSESSEMELSSGRTVAYRAVPLPNAQTMLTFSDVSDARAAERMLRERNEALEQANRIKNDFVKHVNYELRSPLTSIIGFSALLRAPETGPLNPKQSEYLDYIGSSTSSLLTIVNDILDLATIDAGIMELEVSDVDIAATVDHAIDGIRDRLLEHDIALDVDIAEAGTSFRADGPRLTQILFNLLSNAANFAPHGSTVELRAWREADAVAFSVTDHGPGIPPEQIETIFERFESNPDGGRSSGAGLGLSIVKSFVELHHGTITVECPEGAGTRVTCVFPFSPDDPNGADDDESETPTETTEAASESQDFRDAAE